MNITKTNKYNRIYTDDLFLAAIGYYLQHLEITNGNTLH